MRIFIRNFIWASSIFSCMLHSLEHMSFQRFYIRFRVGKNGVIRTGKLKILIVLVLSESESTSSFISIQWIFWTYSDKSGKSRFLLNGQVDADRGAGLNQLLRPGLGSKISLSFCNLKLNSVCLVLLLRHYVSIYAVKECHVAHLKVHWHGAENVFPAWRYSCVYLPSRYDRTEQQMALRKSGPAVLSEDIAQW